MKTRRLQRAIIGLCIAVALLIAAIIIVTSLSHGQYPETYAAEKPGAAPTDAAEYPDDDTVAEEPAPEVPKLEYIYENGYENGEFAALLRYAQNRLSAAAPYGPNIRAGRHYPRDIAAFADAIYAAKADEDTYALLDAINTFRYSIIDYYSRYRPYLATIALGEDVPQKRHLRAAWIATVINIDWPSVEARGTTPYHVDRQKYELRLRFDQMAARNMNAVIFQISPTGDAFYNSALVPWSAWLTGETNFTGQLLDSNGNVFDPLAYAVELARERTMELHAWLNPYRITHSLISYTRGDGITLSSTGEIITDLSEIRAEWATIPGNPFNTMGEYIALGEGRYVLDPGVPAARQWIVDRVMEVVENYDICAIHFDDYFYPSGWNDDVAFARYNTTHPNTPLGRANWRRENTELLIREVNEAIKAAAPWVQFGISPGGVWISGNGTTGLDGGGVTPYTGSASTTSWSNYHSSFADTRRWIIYNFIDYITPQIYWDWSLPAAPYGPIADWWSRLVFDYGPYGHMRNSDGAYTTTRLYIGLGLYRMAENPPAKWRNAEGYEMEGVRTFLRQEHYNLGNPNIHGSMIFAHNHIRPGRIDGTSYAMDALVAGAWRYPALVPAHKHLGGTAPGAPRSVRVEDGAIYWLNGEFSTSQLVRPRYFVIYRSRRAVVDADNPANIYAIIPAVVGQNAYRHGISMANYTDYNFVVTAVNRLHQESIPE
ncbi:MAG: family 10 glycosylhydrolase [Defluviitaleaceae bacterium]|nr:family 10 glycosylhydrolase [Defluviitaleaceae bacterium]